MGGEKTNAIDSYNITTYNIVLCMPKVQIKMNIYIYYIGSYILAGTSFIYIYISLCVYVANAAWCASCSQDTVEGHCCAQHVPALSCCLYINIISNIVCTHTRRMVIYL